jgi:hypothetical protein
MLVYLSMRRAWLGLVLIASAACSNQSLPARAPSIPSSLQGTQPRVVGSNLFLCPFEDGWAGYGDLVYPPNASSKPSASVRPDRCFMSLEEATLAGYRLPPPPLGGVLVHTIYLVPPDPSILPVCREAAHHLGISVLCPSVVPGAANSLVDCEVPDCVYYGAVALQFTFSGPPGYVGIPGQAGNHLFVLEAREGRERKVEFLTCTDGQMVGQATVQGTRAQWVDCPGGSSMNSGHVMLVWVEEGVRYAVSLHGDTELNREIARAVAERLIPVAG